jgi:hypothetical protein
MIRASTSAREAEQLSEQAQQQGYVPLLERLKPEGMFQRIILALARGIIDEQAVPALIDCEATDPEQIVAKAQEWRRGCAQADWIACHIGLPQDLVWIGCQLEVRMDSTLSAALGRLDHDDRLTLTRCPRCHARL